MATYDDLLVLENKLKTPQRDLQFLAIEIYKSKNKTQVSSGKHNKKNIPYSLRRGISIPIPNVSCQKYGINSLNFRGSALWNNSAIKLKKL